MKVLLIVAGTFAATVGTYLAVDAITPTAEADNQPAVAAPVAKPQVPLSTVSPPASSAENRTFSNTPPVTAPAAPTTSAPPLTSLPEPKRQAVATQSPEPRKYSSADVPPIAITPPPPAARSIESTTSPGIVTVPSSFNKSVTDTAAVQNCTFVDKRLPSDTVVVAAGSYSGRPLPFQIDKSNHQATQFDIGVHADKPVALLLSAYDPTVWSIGWTKNTRIVAVFATGYYRQVIAGLPPGVPVITTNNGVQDGCVHQYLSRDNLAWVNPAARAVFGKEAIRVYPTHRDGLIEITESTRARTIYESSPVKTPEMYRDTSAPLAGQAGLDDAIRKGILRKATREDFEKVKVAYVQLAAKQSRTGRPDIPPVAGSPANALPPVPMPQHMGHNGYVALKPFVFPAGLYGRHSITVIVPKGVASPTGNPGHSQVFDLNKEQPCSGPMCY